MKCVYISDTLHKQLKVYAANHGSSVTKIVENAIGNLLSQKPVSVSPSKLVDFKTSPSDSSKVKLSSSKPYTPRGEMNPEDYV